MLIKPYFLILFQKFIKILLFRLIYSELNQLKITYLLQSQADFILSLYNIHAQNMTDIKTPSLTGALPLPKTKVYIIALCLITLSSFGNNYAFNNPQALHESIKQTLHITQSQFQLLYSVFAFPNILSALFIGYLIDFFQIYKGFVILVFMVAFFQGVVATGAYLQSYKVMLVGRLLFGVCSQSLITAQAALVSSLFKRKNLALALGIVITFPEIGNAMNSLLSSRFYQYFGKHLGYAFFMSVIFCTICSIFAILAVRFIKVINKAQQQRQRLQLQKSILLSQIMSQHREEEGEDHKETIRMADLKQLRYSFWILTIICTILVGMYVPFLDGANGLLQLRFRFSEQQAGEIIMVTYFSAALLSIPSGIVVDKIGMRRYVTIFASLILLAVQVILYLSTEQSHTFFIILAFSCLGLGFALYANCVMASVSLIVKRKILGTAFGIVQMLESVALCFFPLISGALVDEGEQSAEGYKDAQLFFIIVGVIGVLCSLGMFTFPRQQKSKLDEGRRRRQKKQRNKKLKLEYGSFTDSDSLSKSLISTKSSISSTNREIQIQDLMNLYVGREKI